MIVWRYRYVTFCKCSYQRSDTTHLINEGHLGVGLVYELENASFHDRLIFTNEELVAAYGRKCCLHCVPCLAQTAQRVVYLSVMWQGLWQKVVYCALGCTLLQLGIISIAAFLLALQCTTYEHART